MNLTGLYRYVRYGDLDEFLKLGWIVAADLGPTHGQWSVLARWLCDCPECVPEKYRQEGRLMMMAFNTDHEREEALADLADALRTKTKTVILALDTETAEIEEAVAACVRERVLRNGRAA